MVDETLEDILLDATWRRFNEMWEDKQNIESKASIIMSASGVILTIMLTFWSSTEINVINNVANNCVANNCIVLFLKGTIFVSALMYLLTILSCVFVIKPREYISIQPSKLTKLCSNPREYEVKGITAIECAKRKLYEILSKYEEKNTKTIANLGKWLKRATILFAIASFLSLFTIAVVLCLL